MAQILVNFKNRIIKMSPFKAIALIFLGLIILGSFLLSLPISIKEGQSNFLDALFTATSATCVTGLIVADTYQHWTFFGQIVILLLIQLGGLGFMTMATLFSIMVGRRITLKERILMTESFNQLNMEGIVRLTLHVLMGTFILEFLGAVILSTQFIPQYGVLGGIYRGIFHSVSAFCNAGFDILGDKSPYCSLTDYISNPVVNLTIMALIITGGLGFGVWEDIITQKSYKKLRLHSKMVLIISFILIIAGTLGTLLFEYNNAATLKNLNFPDKILASLFHSVSMRTAGFNTLSVGFFKDSTKLLSVILMFIGGSPGSTAGGIKTTTVGVVIFTVHSLLKGKNDVNILERRIGFNTIIRAFSIFIIGLISIIIGSFIIMAFDNYSFMDVLFETTSAFGTVGVTTGITSLLSPASKIALIFLMFFGRVGVLTIGLALLLPGKNNSNIRYPEGKISVG